MAATRLSVYKLLAVIFANIFLFTVCQRYWINSRATPRSQESGLYHDNLVQQLEQLHQHIRLQQQEYDRQLAELASKGEVTTNTQPSLKSPPNTPLSSFQVPQELLTTHDIAIPRDVPAWTDTDTAFLGTVAGLDMMADLLKDDYNRHEQLTNPSDIDFTKIGRAARIYKSLWNHIYPIYQTLIPDGQDRDRELALRELAKKHVEIDFFLRLEHRLYPWVHHHRRTAFSLYETYAGQGYVLCAGNRQFEFVVASIQAIRSKLKSKLPIQVFYINHWDLSEERRTFLREMTHDIEVLDISTILDNGLMKLGGWSIKAFSILASRFEEVMLIDSDVFFLRSPDELFSDPGYLATGALYFYDRTLGGAGRAGPDWIRAVVPFMSTFPRSTRTFRGKSDHEQESGVVLINKRKRFSGLLSVCKLNSKYERDLWTYKKFYGDKETFWSGFEIVQEPYAFVRNYGGAIGELREDNEHSVCGAQLHLDYLGRPIWWNGGVMRNKNEGVKQDLNFGYWMSGGGNQPHRERIVRDEDSVRDLLFDIGLSSMDEVKQDDLQDPVWDFRPSCLAGWTVNSLDENQVSLATSYVRLDKVAKEVEKKIQAKTPANPSEYDWDNV